jgi:hypothetical protein
MAEIETPLPRLDARFPCLWARVAWRGGFIGAAKIEQFTLECTHKIRISRWHLPQ